jgi:RNA ligase
MKLGELLDIDKLDFHRREGFVGCQFHPTLPLRIYNYTARAAFANAWGDGTIDYCRGLIVNEENEIVARPFRKFHNLGTPSMPETMAENLPPYLPEITKKMDGSLGIWYPDGTPEGAIATRGSFTSPQALWATDWWKLEANAARRQEGLYGPWKGYWTPLFEIIYPENRIVVDYGNFSGLVCIGGVDINTGLDVLRKDVANVLGDLLVDKIHISHKDMLSTLANFNVPNEEGYVASYDHGRLRVKIKFEDYKRLHRIITGVNPHSVWEMVSDPTVQQIDASEMPANFAAWLGKWIGYLEGEFNRIQTEAVEIHGGRPFREFGEPDRMYRASYARYVMAETKERAYLKPILFDMFDGYDGSKVIWKMLEPAGNDMRFSTSGIDATADV